MLSGLDYYYHNDDLSVIQYGKDQPCEKYYGYYDGDPDYCQHSFFDGGLSSYYANLDDTLYDDAYYSIADIEWVMIHNAAGDTFNITVSHVWDDDDYYGELATYNDHILTGELTVVVNGQDVGQTWKKDVDENVDTHILDEDNVTYVRNGDFDEVLVVRMDCSDLCECTFQQLE